MLIKSAILSSVALLCTSAYGNENTKENNIRVEGDEKRGLTTGLWAGYDGSGGIPMAHPGYFAPAPGSGFKYDGPRVPGGSYYGPGPSYGGGAPGYGGTSGSPYYVDPDREKNKCELKLENYVWDYLYYLGFRFPTWCCLLSVLAPPTYDDTGDYVPDFNHVKLVVESIFKTAEDDGYTETDMNLAFSSIARGYGINGEESGFGSCKLGYHKCQLIWGLMKAYREGLDACYCYYRTMGGCECENCLDPDLWLDEIAAYKGLPTYGDEVLNVDTGAESAYAVDKLLYTRIATCVQCPGYPPRPYNKCYGYCNIVKSLPYNEVCFPDA